MVFLHSKLTVWRLDLKDISKNRDRRLDRKLLPQSRAKNWWALLVIFHDATDSHCSFLKYLLVNEYPLYSEYWVQRDKQKEHLIPFQTGKWKGCDKCYDIDITRCLAVHVRDFQFASETSKCSPENHAEEVWVERQPGMQNSPWKVWLFLQHLDRFLGDEN